MYLDSLRCFLIVCEMVGSRNGVFFPYRHGDGDTLRPGSHQTPACCLYVCGHASVIYCVRVVVAFFYQTLSRAQRRHRPYPVEYKDKVAFKSLMLICP